VDTIVEIISEVNGHAYLARWASADRGYVGEALKSPLTGYWFAVPREGWPRRVKCLRGARMFVMGGNGRQRGRHTNVSLVVTV
jgi:hypothetical protein